MEAMMKKILIALAFLMCVVSANATTIIRPVSTYSQGYAAGYSHGKDDAYANVGRTVVIVGAVVIASVMIYELGRESRWTANEKGVVYRF
jgi:hypothetical protein